MLASSRPKACTSRTPEMLSSRLALTLPISMRVLPEGLARLVREPDGGHDHERHHRHADQRVGDAEREHVDGDPDQQQHAAEHVDQREADRLLDGFHVVGDAAHHRPGLVFG